MGTQNESAKDSARKGSGPTTSANADFDNNLMSTLQSLKGASVNNRLMARLNNLVAMGAQSSSQGAKIRKPSDYNANDFFAKLPSKFLDKISQERTGMNDSSKFSDLTGTFNNTECASMLANIPGARIPDSQGNKENSSSSRLAAPSPAKQAAATAAAAVDKENNSDNNNNASQTASRPSRLTERSLSEVAGEVNSRRSTRTTTASELTSSSRGASPAKSANPVVRVKDSTLHFARLSAVDSEATAATSGAAAAYSPIVVNSRVSLGDAATTTREIQDEQQPSRASYGRRSSVHKRKLDYQPAPETPEAPAAELDDSEAATTSKSPSKSRSVSAAADNESTHPSSSGLSKSITRLRKKSIHEMINEVDELSVSRGEPEPERGDEPTTTSKIRVSRSNTSESIGKLVSLREEEQDVQVEDEDYEEQERVRRTSRSTRIETEIQRIRNQDGAQGKAAVKETAAASEEVQVVVEKPAAVTKNALTIFKSRQHGGGRKGGNKEDSESKQSSAAAVSKQLSSTANNTRLLLDESRTAANQSPLRAEFVNHIRRSREPGRPSVIEITSPTAGNQQQQHVAKRTGKKVLDDEEQEVEEEEEEEESDFEMDEVVGGSDDLFANAVAPAAVTSNAAVALPTTSTQSVAAVTMIPEDESVRIQSRKSTAAAVEPEAEPKRSKTKSSITLTKIDKQASREPEPIEMPASQEREDAAPTSSQQRDLLNDPPKLLLLEKGAASNVRIKALKDREDKQLRDLSIDLVDESKMSKKNNSMPPPKVQMLPPTQQQQEADEAADDELRSFQKSQFIGKKSGQRGSTITLMNSVNTTSSTTATSNMSSVVVAAQKSASIFSASARSRRDEFFVEPTVNDIPSKAAGKKKSSRRDETTPVAPSTSKQSSKQDRGEAEASAKRSADEKKPSKSSKEKAVDSIDSPPDNTSTEPVQSSKSSSKSDKRALRNITNESRPASDTSNNKNKKATAPEQVSENAGLGDYHDDPSVELVEIEVEAEAEVEEAQPRTSKDRHHKSSKSSKSEKKKEKEKRKESKKSRRERSPSEQPAEAEVEVEQPAASPKKGRGRPKKTTTTATPTKSKSKKRPQEDHQQVPVSYETGNSRMHVPDVNADNGELRRSKRVRVDKNSQPIYGYEATEDADGHIIVLSKIIGFQRNKYMDELRMQRAMGPVPRKPTAATKKPTQSQKTETNKSKTEPTKTDKKSSKAHRRREPSSDASMLIVDHHDDHIADDDGYGGYGDHPAPASPVAASERRSAERRRSVSLDSQMFDASSRIDESQESVAIFDKHTRHTVGVSTKTARQRLLCRVAHNEHRDYQEMSEGVWIASLSGEMGVMKFAARAKSRTTDHDHKCTFVIQQGTFVFNRENVLTKHSVADIIVIPKGQSYRIKNVSDGEATLAICFDL